MVKYLVGFLEQFTKQLLINSFTVTKIADLIPKTRIKLAIFYLMIYN